MTSQSLIVTGVIRRMVVTLSKNEETIAVKRQRQMMSGQIFPFVI